MFLPLKPRKMKREDLQLIAVLYLKQHTGLDAEMLRFTHENDGIQEYILELGHRDRLFEIWMLPLHNRIELTEKHHKGTFADAAALAGLDTNLKNL